MKKISMDKKLISYELAIENALRNSSILQSLSQYGYNEARIQQGKQLLVEAKTNYEKHKNEYATQFEATENLKKASDEAYKIYMITFKVAKIAFKKDINAQTCLTLNETRKKDFAGWLDQADRMYKNLLGLVDSTNIPLVPLSQTIAGYGYTTVKLQAEYDNILKVKSLNMIQKKETGTAQDLTKIKDTSIKALDDWMNDYYQIAKITFRDKKDLLEQLGITIKDKRAKNSKEENNGTAAK